MKIYINGSFYSRDDAKISVFDHGLLYGDGVFEGIRVYNGRIFKLHEHLQRLRESAHYIMLSLPMSLDELARATIETVRVNGIRDGYVRLVVTRGVGDLGLNPLTCKQPHVIIIADRIALYPAELYERGMSIITVPTQRVGGAMLSPRVKSLNYLNNIMAKLEAINAGYEEAVMINQLGFVAECTGDNIFVVKRGIVQTPPANMGALEGITRGVVIELARAQGLQVEEIPLTRHDLFCADECFLTGTAAELIAVISVDHRQVGDGKPGPITRKLTAAFRQLTQSTGTPVYEE